MLKNEKLLKKLTNEKEFPLLDKFKKEYVANKKKFIKDNFTEDQYAWFKVKSKHPDILFFIDEEQNEKYNVAFYNKKTDSISTFPIPAEFLLKNLQEDTFKLNLNKTLKDDLIYLCSNLDKFNTDYKIPIKMDIDINLYRELDKFFSKRLEKIDEIQKDELKNYRILMKEDFNFEKEAYESVLRQYFKMKMDKKANLYNGRIEKFEEILKESNEKLNKR